MRNRIPTLSGARRAAGDAASPPRSARPGRGGRAVLALLSVVLGPACGPSPPVRDDLLIVSLDTLRADHLSCYGYERDTSPFLDSLAAEGVRFADANAPASNTAPSHMSMLTGLDPLAHGIRPVGGAKDRIRSLSPRSSMLAEILQEAGYRTIGIADDGYVMTDMGFGRGFDEFDNRRTSLSTKLTLLSTKLKQTDPDRPLFVFFHTYETHAPYLPPPPFHGRFTDPDHTGPFRERYEALAELPAQVAWKEKRGFLEPWDGMGEADLDYLRGLYDEGIAYADSRLERLWQIWSRRRDPDRTLLIVLSDHGEGFFEHGRLGHQYGLYSELLRVPLIVRGPGIHPRVVEEPVSLTDVVPTVLEWLDLPIGPHQGDSLLGLLRGAPETERSVVSQLNARGGLHDSIVTEGLHLLRWNRASGDKIALYDRTNDREEQRDLSEDRTDERAALEARLEARRAEGARHQERFPNLVGGELTERDRRELEALGYMGDEGYVDEIDEIDEAGDADE